MITKRFLSTACAAAAFAALWLGSAQALPLSSVPTNSPSPSPTSSPRRPVLLPTPPPLHSPAPSTSPRPPTPAPVPPVPVPPQRPIPPVPPPDLTLVAAPDLGPDARISFANATFARLHSKRGHFGLIGVRLLESVDVQLRYLPALAGAQIVAQELDGGKATTTMATSTLNADGIGSFRFQAGDQPGLYRVLVSTGATRSIMKFWVADPKNNPPALISGN